MKLKFRLCCLLVLVGVTLATSARAQESGGTGKAETDKALTEEISQILRDCEKIKPGMTRAQLMELFNTEGGIWTAKHRTFIFRRCNYVKVDVEFELTKPDQDGLDQKMTDTIRKISKPYLEWRIID